MMSVHNTMKEGIIIHSNTVTVPNCVPAIDDAVEEKSVSVPVTCQLG